MVITLALLVICFSLHSSIVYGAASTWPAPIPLFHKSPYLNAWINPRSNVSNSLAQRWPQFFNQKNVGWFIGIRVDGTTYTIQGDSRNVNYTAEGTTVSTYIMPTQTRFTIAAGPVFVNLTYLTPIELQDWTLHSFPFAYAAFDIISSDNNPHAIQLYTDISGQFVSSDYSNVITWNTNLTDKSIYHMAQQRTLRPLIENDDMSEDGSQFLAYSMTPGVSMTWQTGLGQISRTNFSVNGKLENSSDINFRAINVSWPALAFALDLGSITQTSNTLVFGVGLIRHPAVSYRIANTSQHLYHLWHSRWGNIGSAIDDILTSYSSASSRANALDDRIQLDASTLASQLNMSTATATKLIDLHILNLRQTIGSLEFTTAKPGEPVAVKDVRVFMKDVGYSSRTNPVEILYASFPAFLFLNTTLAGKLLEPLLEVQSSSSRNYAAPDLGSSWPDIHGNAPDQPLLALDSCGAMLIMALVHARKSGDGTLLFNYYDLLRKWADYLVQSTTRPGSSMSSDALYTSNANLALKGIMGLYAMGKINKILEARGADSSKSSYYSDIAYAYAQDWLNQAMSSDHIMATYGSNSTWAMIYNLFAPRLLGATIIPEQIYETQASWYANSNMSAGIFGHSFDSIQSLAKAHWTLLSASSVFNATSSAGRDDLISMVHSRSFWQLGVTPNPATYSPTDGTQPRGSASPAMGAVYSLLALNLPDLTPVTLPLGPLGNKQPATHNVPLIVGATFGTLGGLILIAAIVFFLRRRRRLKSVHIDGPSEESHQRQPKKSNITPFTDEVEPFMTQDQSLDYLQTGGKPSKIARDEKFPTTPNATDSSSVAGRSSPTVTSSRDGENTNGGHDSNLREEVEQLRRVVETLQVQQPQLVYQQGSLPDEPPPMYHQQPATL